MSAYAEWFLFKPNLWGFYAIDAAFHRPVLTLIRGLPWEDVQ